MINNKNEFPDDFFRGLSDSNSIVDGMVADGAFQFEAYDSNKRKDGFCELSINWNDDDGSRDVLKNQSKNDKNGNEVKQFAIGYCILKRAVVDDVLRYYRGEGTFKYERDPISEDLERGIHANPYHGNLLLSNQMPKRLKKLIQCTLATVAGRAWEW